MASVHLITGARKIGKTETARIISLQRNALLLSVKETAFHFFGTEATAEQIDLARAYIWKLSESVVSAGGAVVIDDTLETPFLRQRAFERAKSFAEYVTFHQIEKNNSKDDNYTPISADERYDDVLYYRY
ncbi:MAG: hypothetical protein MJ250_04095 [Alphaproteobacteria bacterium]|nr:hypothetical protein [Alphaproteobacteria bacterium]